MQRFIPVLIHKGAVSPKRVFRAAASKASAKLGSLITDARQNRIIRKLNIKTYEYIISLTF